MIEVTSTVEDAVVTLEYQPVVIKNAGPVTVYLGTAVTVTADTTATGGYPLAPGEELYIEPKTASSTYEIDYYAVTATGSAYLAVLVRG